MGGIARVVGDDGHAGADHLVWLHVSPVKLKVRDGLVPPGTLSPMRADIAGRGHYRADRDCIVQAPDSQHVPSTEWSGPDRWCYEVQPDGQIEPDRDPTHRHFDS